MTLTVCRRPPAAPTAPRNRNAAGLRIEISNLHDDILRGEVYGDRPLSSAEIRRRLKAIGEGQQNG